MVDCVDIFISENIVTYFNRVIERQNETIIDDLSKSLFIDRKQIIDVINEKKEKVKKKKRKKKLNKSIIKPGEECMARIWNSGYGGFCKKRRDPNNENSEYCCLHSKEMAKNKFLRYGRRDMISPFRLPKNLKEPYMRCEFKKKKNDQETRCKNRKCNNQNYCKIHNKFFDNYVKK